MHHCIQSWFEQGITCRNLQNALFIYEKLNIDLNFDILVVERNPCEQCGENAECTIEEDSVICKCPENFIGNPHLVCRPECTINEDCPRYLACQNLRCSTPCPGACGKNAICDVLNHRPACSCPFGFIGDPYTECRQRKYTFIFYQVVLSILLMVKLS